MELVTMAEAQKRLQNAKDLMLLPMTTPAQKYELSQSVAYWEKVIKELKRGEK